MDLTQDFADSGFVITGYQTGRVLVNDKPYSKSLIVSPERLVTAWEITSIRQLDRDSFSTILDVQPEIVLVGSDEPGIFPGGEVLAWLARQKIGLEYMNLTAACRTYGILVSEGRRVAAALIFPD